LGFGVWGFGTRERPPPSMASRTYSVASRSRPACSNPSVAYSDDVRIRGTPVELVGRSPVGGARYTPSRVTRRSRRRRRQPAPPAVAASPASPAGRCRDSTSPSAVVEVGSKGARKSASPPSASDPMGSSGGDGASLPRARSRSLLFFYDAARGARRVSVSEGDWRWREVSVPTTEQGLLTNCFGRPLKKGIKTAKTNRSSPLWRTPLQRVNNPKAASTSPSPRVRRRAPGPLLLLRAGLDEEERKEGGGRGVTLHIK
jgi:hypothetical protein